MNSVSWNLTHSTSSLRNVLAELISRHLMDGIRTANMWVYPKKRATPPPLPTFERLSWWLVDSNLFSERSTIDVQLGNWHELTTSSTAQGGGGSFKNRKPIGEIGCCESRMAERIHWWTERWLELCFLEWLQWLQWSPGRSPHPQLLDVVWCSAAVVVVVV